MSQNPYGEHSTGHPPHPNYGPTPGSGSNTVLIVLVVVGGVLLLVFLACGTMGFLAFRNVSDTINQMTAAMEEGAEEEARFWVDTYGDHQIVKEKLGTVLSYNAMPMDWTDENLNLEIDVTGDKASGILRIEYAEFDEAEYESDDFDYESRMNCYLIIDGEKILIDSEAGSKYDDWDGY